MEQLSDTDELYAISEATNNDGTIDVELEGWNRYNDGDRVSLQFILPTGDVKCEDMDWPKEDSEEYKFVRIFNQTGYGIISAEEACKNNVIVQATRDPWEIVAPESQSTIDKIKQFVNNNFRFGYGEDSKFLLLLVFYPIVALFSLAEIILRSDMNDKARGYSMALWHTLLWLTPLFLILIL